MRFGEDLEQCFNLWGRDRSVCTIIFRIWRSELRQSCGTHDKISATNSHGPVRSGHVKPARQWRVLYKPQAHTHMYTTTCYMRQKLINDVRCITCTWFLMFHICMVSPYIDVSATFGDPQGWALSKPDLAIARKRFRSIAAAGDIYFVRHSFQSHW